ncbi:tyrosine-protein phosphatase [Aeromicrobium choanae]|nr:tyrosine-protein phosphatase [Aeromicrobium choanae]
MTSRSDPSRLASAPNLRDLGGWPVRGGGTVRRGEVYRSAGLGRVTPEDLTVVTGLGLRAVYDLRTVAERDLHPDVLPIGVDAVALDVLADSSQNAAASIDELLGDPVAISAVLADGRATDLLAEAYRDIVRLDSARHAYGELFTRLADGARRPALFHCTTGKDRTGWAAAVLLLLLGVDEEHVRADYLRTNDDLLPALQPMLDDFAGRGGDPELLLPVLGVRGEYLDAALAQLRTEHDSVEDYVRNGLGVAGSALDALRTGLIDGQPKE